MKKKTVISLLSIAVALTLISFVFCGLFLHMGNTRLQVSIYNVVSSRIPTGFDGFKIAQISDFHNEKSVELNDHLLREVGIQQPDIIVLTGDLIDSNRTDIDVAINFVNKAVTVAPVFFVSGNHEANTSEYPQLLLQLEAIGVTVLNNRMQVLERSGAEINIIGIDDPRLAHENSVTDLQIINTELNNIVYDTGRFSILLSHRPEAMEVYAEKELDLVLAGHAHGGQVRMPFIGGLYAPNQGFFPKYTVGRYDKNSTVMIVSRGIGNSVLPLRINNRPELVVVTLNKA